MKHKYQTRNKKEKKECQFLPKKIYYKNFLTVKEITCFFTIVLRKLKKYITDHLQVI